MVGKFLAVNADIHRAGADVASAGYGYDQANGFLWKISGIGRRKNDREKMLKVMFLTRNLLFERGAALNRIAAWNITLSIFSRSFLRRPMPLIFHKKPFA